MSRISRVYMLILMFSLAVLVVVTGNLGGRARSQAVAACPTVRGGVISSAYGWRPSTGSWHAGIDVGVSYEPIYAAESGEVVTEWYYGYQITKDLKADSGRVYRYAHLSEGGVDGRVNAGDRIGTSGDGSGAYAAHLHWEIRTDGGGFGFDGTLNPTDEFYAACSGSDPGHTSPPVVVSNPGGITQPAPQPQPDPQPAPQIGIPAPSLNATCRNGQPIVNIGWNNPGVQGVTSYIVDVDDDNFVSEWWNRDVGFANVATAPDNFQTYPNPGGASLALASGRTYQVRIYYAGPGRHSPAVSFQASYCSSTTSQSTQIVSAPSSSSRQVVGFESNRCLDVEGYGTSNGSKVHIWDCHGESNQQWTIHGNGEIRIYGNKCLDVEGYGTSNGSRVHIWDCHGEANQRWSRNGNEIRIYGNKCLDVEGHGTGNGSNVHIWDCHGGANQQWRY